MVCESALYSPSTVHLVLTRSAVWFVLQLNSHVVTIDDYEDVPENSEDDLKKAVANQPVSVAIEAGGREFQFYSTVSFCPSDLRM